MASVWRFSGICVTTTAMRLRFLDCTLDMSRREFRRAGEPVRLRPRVFELLALLVDQRQRAVPKAEIFERIWPKRVVTDATLLSCIKELRKAVGDQGDTQRVIQTLHGHGFRFVASVEPDEIPPEAVPSASAQQTHLGIAPIDREHKQVSVLVCALADAETLAGRLGAEGMDEAMQRLLRRTQAAAERYSGTISECSGAGLVIVFGAPVAIEDHGRRAVHTALHLLLSPSDGDVRLKFGLDTGAAVIGSTTHTPAGETALRARRLCEQAGAGEMLASEASFRLVEAEVAAESRPPAYRITSIRNRAGVSRRPTRARSRFVGRSRELDLLRDRLSRARAGTGHVVCLSGEAGIGKSRVLEEFRALPDVQSGTHCAVAHCFPHHATTPYGPVMALLRQWGSFAETESSEHVVTQLNTLLVSAGIATPDARALLLQLLDIPSDEDVLAELSPETRRARTFKYLTQLLMHRASVEPCLVMIEDVHWIDASSEAFLAQLVTRLAALRVLLIVTARPGYQPPWAGLSTVTQLGLLPLSIEESVLLVDSVPHRAELSESRVREVVNTAQGNPFFLEEFTWTLAERGAGAVERVSVPGTVKAVLAARIDKLGSPEKTLLQVASIIGLRFEEQLLRRACGYDAQAFESSLQELQSREFIYQSAAAPRSELAFRHALILEVTYQSLLTAVRALHHQRIGEILEQEFPETSASEPEVLAVHWSGAGRHDRAFASWRQAGQRALERSASLEAVAHLKSALEVHRHLGDAPDRLRERLELLLMLGPPLMAVRGFAAEDVEENYLRARELCDQFGSAEQRFTTVWGLWLHNLHRGRIDLAKALSQEVLAIAARIDAPSYRLQAHHAAWTTEQTHGDLESCLDHSRRGMQLYEPDKHHAQAYLYGMHDPGICAHGTAALAEWYLGRPDTALKGAFSTLKLAQSLQHPYSELLALMNLVWIHGLRGEAREAQACASDAIALCTEHHFPNYLAYSRFLHGWACAVGGNRAAGVEEMRDGLAQYRSLGLARHSGQLLTILAECLTASCEFDSAQESIEEARALLEQTAELRWKPEVYRVSGEVLLARSPAGAAEAESSMTRALATAREQHARTLELRAATSLARLWIQTGRTSAAGDLLTTTMSAFEEGHSTSDFRAAMALLATT
jgi:DNA-binding winged helix-turn-helix (wHTH) protein/predicted ATPase